MTFSTTPSVNLWFGMVTMRPARVLMRVLLCRSFELNRHVRDKVREPCAQAEKKTSVMSKDKTIAERDRAVQDLEVCTGGLLSVGLMVQASCRAQSMLACHFDVLGMHGRPR